MNHQYCQFERKDELDCLVIDHPLFKAELLLQGAQLIYFAPKNHNLNQEQDNWLWLSELAEFKTGQSVRGGIPICWPWFGNPLQNPAAVQSHIFQPEQAPAHGFVRTLPFILDAVEEHPDSLVIKLSCAPYTQEYSDFHLALSVEFEFSANSIGIKLITRNVGTAPQSFTQALHTYFPTSDIHQTQLLGLHNAAYVDTLDNWKEKRQEGAVAFTAETDRIYYSSSELSLRTPKHQTQLKNTGSASMVVWNPWIEKSQRLSQFDKNAYLNMFCVESCNAAQDFITLTAQSTHSLELSLSFS